MTRPEPRTAAGRALLDDLAYTRDNYLDSILAIEEEAGGLAIREARMIAAIEREHAEARPAVLGVSANQYAACPRCAHRHLDYLNDEGCVSCGCPWETDLEAALAAERHATVERIKEALVARGWRLTDEDYVESDAEISQRMAADVDFILDAELSASTETDSQAAR